MRGNTTIDQTVSWSVAGPGSIDSGGVFTGGSTPGPVTITATSKQDDSSSASVSFALSNQVGATVDVDPSTYVLPAGCRYAGGANPLVKSPVLERRILIPSA